ncbi:MAG: hypothetical protein P8J87_00555 [Verrucomicrobiales bacterium]|nr:hypothetical protein [Verrucomicrobiales bacterium]
MKTDKQTLVLSGEDLARITNRVGIDQLMDRMISRLEEALTQFSTSIYAVPVRGGFHYRSPRPGLIEWMPSYRLGKSIAMKMVGYHPQNPSVCGLPTILSSLSLFDASTGHLCLVADGNFLTALRTAAASAIASRRMAIADSHTLGLIGTGAQAISQLHALTRCFPIETVLLFDTNRSVSESFAARLAGLGLQNVNLRVCNVSDVVSKSEILCVATSVGINEGPVFSGQLPHLPYLHINAVGSDLPGKTELPLPLLQQSTVIPDFREQAIHEGESQQLEAHEIGPDLPVLLKNPGLLPHVRESLSVFDSTGFALEDLITTEMIFELATELKIGTSVEIESSASDPHNPYEFLNLSSEIPQPAHREYPAIT